MDETVYNNKARKKPKKKLFQRRRLNIWLEGVREKSLVP